MAKKETAKVSPLKGMTVDAWVKAKTKGWQREVADELVALVKKAAPKATHAVKWAIPVFDVNGPFAFIKCASKHVTFGFWRGAALDDPDELLEGGDRMKHIKITSAEDLDAAVLTKFVKQAVALNEKLGDPTKR
jgi:hypothetical protein